MIERDTQGKHQVGKILLPPPADDKKTSSLLQNNNNNNNQLNETCSNCDDMNGLKSNCYLNSAKHNAEQSLNPAPHHSTSTSYKAKYASLLHTFNNMNNNNNNNNSNNMSSPINANYNINSSSVQSTIFAFNSKLATTPSQLPTLSKTESLLKSKMKKFINKMPNHGTSNVSALSNSTANSVRLKHSQKMVEQTCLMPPPPPQQHHRSVSSTGKPTSGLLKFTRTSSIEPSTTGYSSLNDDSSSDFIIENTPVYTETKLPPRILKKYQKKANTESLLASQLDELNIKMNDTGSETGSGSGQFSSSGMGSPITYNEPKQELSPNEEPRKVILNRTRSKSPLPAAEPVSSPQPPPRIKKKYSKKSKTADLSRFQYLFSPSPPTADADSLDSETDSIEGDKRPQEESVLDYSFNLDQVKKDSLNENINNLQTLTKQLVNDLNDSLESIGIPQETEKEETCKTELERLIQLGHDELNLEEDSLLLIENPQETIEQKNLSKRAQWDKTRLQLDLMYFNFSKQRQEQQEKKPDAAPVRSVSKSGTRRDSTDSNTKKSCKLNLAKEKLYEMKLNLDSMSTSRSPSVAARNLPVRQVKTTPTTPVGPKPAPKSIPIQSVNTNSRTTPRKVKKRSGERSLTTGIVSETDIGQLNINKSTENLSSNKPTTRSRSPFVKTATPLRTNIPKASSSMHNISHCFNEAGNSIETMSVHSARNRHDSIGSTASSGTCTYSSSGFNSTANDYKENKAYELRKKCAIMNKIIVKTQFDPIYSRSHPVCTELNDQQAVNFIERNIANTSIGSYEQAARKRLFAKRNEKGFDANLSIGSNASTASSSTTNNSFMPASKSMNFAAQAHQSRLAKPTRANNTTKNTLNQTQNKRTNPTTKVNQNLANLIV